MKELFPILCDHKENGRPCAECIDKAIKMCVQAAYVKGFAEGLSAGSKIERER